MKKENKISKRTGKLLFSIWMVLNNIDVDRLRSGRSLDKEVEAIKNKIFSGIPTRK